MASAGGGYTSPQKWAQGAKTSSCLFQGAAPSTWIERYSM